MAFWKRTPTGKIKGWEWDNAAQKQIAIKRERIRHLDTATDDQVEAFFQNLSATQAARKLSLEGIPDKILFLIDKFCRHQALRRKRRGTISRHRRHLNLAAQYFAAKSDKINDWPLYSINLRTHFLEKGHSEIHINKIQLSLAMFWKWLIKYEKLAITPLDLDETVGHAGSKDTPLKHHLNPEDVLKFVDNTPHIDIKLMALFGYFASLRPQETFALNKQDLIGGEEATEFECSKVMQSIGQYHGLVVDVIKQRGKKKSEIFDPKKHSQGLVSFFNRDAAFRLITILENMEGDLFTNCNDYYTKRWSQHGIKEVTLKDLRRASIYWLGNYTTIQLQSLFLHARHKNVQTTALYFRRAKEKPKTRTLKLI